MQDHPFRTLGTIASLMLAALIGWAVTLGGYSLNEDPEVEKAGAWARDFKFYEPEAAREVGKECKAELTRSPWTRDGALDLFTCIRRKGEAKGYYFEEAPTE